jgi:DNA-binding NarL/FixJ family response regulator
MLEYREAAFRNGADHFMVKGNSTEADILGLVESLLQARFVSLLIVGDLLPRKQLYLLLTLRWPIMVVAEADDAATGLGHAKTLKPDLVLLELDLPRGDVADLIRGLREESPHSTLVGMVDSALLGHRQAATEFDVDHCLPLSPDGHTHLVRLVASLQAGQTRH